MEVLTNNIFMEQYPIAAAFGDDTKKILLEHFTEPEDSDEPLDENLGSVAKLADIFVGLKACGDFLVGVYNDEQLLSEPKVRVLNLFDTAADETLAEVDADAAQNFFDLQEETDFVAFAREVLFSTPTEIFLRTDNYIGDKEKLRARLKILQADFAAQTKIFLVRTAESKPAFTRRKEFTEILQRHWGYNAFRNFQVYDLQKLNADIKSTFTVSQEQIIADIVEQVERCMANETFCDVL